MTNNPTPAEKRKATILSRLMEEHQIALEQAQEMYIANQKSLGSKGGKSETSFRGFRDMPNLARTAGKKGGSRSARRG